jgi:two-component system, OmpR family, lantibiotic biosynthesis response regulator NisR/SpaR
VPKSKIIIVDDDKDIVNLVEDILTDEGYEIEKAYNGRDALEKINKNHFDLIILDIMLPDIDGLEVCRKIRDSVDVPILFLTAKSKSIDKVVGFEIGADDYITKPFDDNELASRVKAHIRRQKRVAGNTAGSGASVRYDGIEINKNSYEVFLDGKKVDLSTREFQILAFLMNNPNIVLTREQIYNNVWGYEDFGDINTVTVHIKKLREKIDKNDRFIKTVWGAGYKFIGEN